MRIVILVACFWLVTSPLYAKIVFSSNRDDTSYEIFTMNTDGGEPIQITNNRSDSLSPTWSPDGRQIAFNRGSHIYVIDADRENLRQLTRPKNNEQDLHPRLVSRWEADSLRQIHGGRARPPCEYLHGGPGHQICAKGD